jgi:hypothetical protein
MCFPPIFLLPNFDNTSQSKQDLDLTSIALNFGPYLYQHFNKLLYQIQIQYQFKKDDLMVKRFTDAVPTGEIWIELEVVPKEKLKDIYNECKVADGEVILGTIPSDRGTNPSYVADRLSNWL